jgi:hypothetical protein
MIVCNLFELMHGMAGTPLGMSLAVWLLSTLAIVFVDMQDQCRFLP